MKIAVTGATGFLGRYIVAHLAGRGTSSSAGTARRATWVIFLQRCLGARSPGSKAASVTTMARGTWFKGLTRWFMPRSIAPRADSEVARGTW